MMQLEKRFERDDQFRNRYVSAMQEYFSLGHAVVAPKLSAGQPSYFIPHLAVIKESSLTTKTRIVFDASSPSSNSLSLNDNLMVGPTILLKQVCTM